MSDPTSAKSRLNNAIKQLRLAREEMDEMDDLIEISKLDYHIRELKRMEDHQE